MLENAVVTWLDTVTTQNNGLYSAGKSKYIVAHDASTARSVEPFHSRHTYPHRSVFGFFPEHHSWFKLEALTDYQGSLSTAHFGYTIPIVVFVFHRFEAMPKL